MILKEIDNSNACRYRIENVVIIGEKHILPKYFELYYLMQKLIKEYTYDWGTLHPVIRATLLHGEFQKIYPFVDGNGRIARLLLKFELMRSGYTPIIIKNEQRALYYDVPDLALTTMEYGSFFHW
jgi:Fic family protein